MAKPIRARDIEMRFGSIYPAEFARAAEGRAKRALGNAFGLDQFGVNLTTLEPGAQSALRHWHSAEDEFVYVLSGTVTLVSDDGDQEMTAGDVVGFKAATADGHHFINRSNGVVELIEVGARLPEIDAVAYPDDDLAILPDGSGKRIFRRTDGSEI